MYLFKKIKLFCQRNQLVTFISQDITVDLTQLLKIPIGSISVLMNEHGKCAEIIEEKNADSIVNSPTVILHQLSRSLIFQPLSLFPSVFH